MSSCLLVFWFFLSSGSSCLLVFLSSCLLVFYHQNYIFFHLYLLVDFLFFVSCLSSTIKITYSSISIYSLKYSYTTGVYFVPAFSGLYAPHWRDDGQSCLHLFCVFFARNHHVEYFYNIVLTFLPRGHVRPLFLFFLFFFFIFSSFLQSTWCYCWFNQICK